MITGLSKEFSCTSQTPTKDQTEGHGLLPAVNSPTGVKGPGPPPPKASRHQRRWRGVVPIEPRVVVKVRYVQDEQAARRVLELLRQGFRQGLRRKALEQKKTG